MNQRAQGLQLAWIPVARRSLKPAAFAAGALLVHISVYDGFLRVHLNAVPAFLALTHINHGKPCSRAELRPACPRMQPRHMHTAGRVGGTGFQAKRCLPG